MLKKNKKDFSVCLQSEQKDCGVACLLTILKFHKGNNNYENLRQISGTNVTGTTLLGLYHAAEKIGFNAEGCEADLESLSTLNNPCILHVIINNMQHYVVYYGLDKKNNIIIGDPARGVSSISNNELENIWQSKACLLLTPNNDFIKKDDTIKEKRKWLLKFIKEDKPYFIMAVILGVCIALLGLAMAIFSQKLIDDILPNKKISKIYLGTTLVFLVLAIKEFFSLIRQHFLLRQAKEFNIRIIDFFYSHLLKLPKQFFDSRKIGELTARLNDTLRIQRVISQISGSVIIDVLIAIISIAFISIYSWEIGLLCIILLPIFYSIIFFNNDKIIESQRSVMSNYASVEANFISTLQGIEPIIHFNKQNIFSENNKALYLQYQNSIIKLGKTQIKLSFIANIFTIFFLSAIIIISSIQVLNNTLKIGQIIAILSLASSLLPSIANLAMIAIPISEAKIAFDRMFDFTNIKPERDIYSVEHNSISQFHKLEFNEVSFRFNGRSQLFSNVSLKINKGEIIALMGENGSGKSTLTQIIGKHYLHENGKIIINDNVKFSKVALKEWRNICAIVPQNIHLFNGSILENISFDDAFNQTQSVLDFINYYGFNTYFDKYPQSVFTIIGEEGINISGGQKQIIAIARALYSNPQLLVLDEATSAMDREAEQFILKLIEKVKSKMGVLVITHRLHILKSYCDRIYILKDGVVSIQGTHAELLLSDNLYSQYWNDLS